MAKDSEKRSIKVGRVSLELSNEDKILFPKSKITKGDLIAYYEKVASFMIPKIKDRPVSMLRYPNGIQKEGFFQKNISDYFPKWIKTSSIKRKEKANMKMLVCNDKATLLYLANQACITPHIWLSKIDKLRYPDRMIFDLDPSKNDFCLVKEGAKALREVLEEELNLKTFVMTTGSKGLHVVVPIKRDFDFDAVRAFARGAAQLLSSHYPEKYTTEQRIQKRGKRLFIDYLRNGYAQTGVSPYAVRALEKAPIATPIDWKELGSVHAQSFHIKNIFQRISKKKDPWKNIETSSRSLKTAMKKLEKLLEKRKAC